MTELRRICHRSRAGEQNGVEGHDWDLIPQSLDHEADALSIRRRRRLQKIDLPRFIDCEHGSCKSDIHPKRFEKYGFIMVQEYFGKQKSCRRGVLLHPAACPPLARRAA